MKKSLILIAIFAIISCKEDPKVDYAIISGEILNKDKEDVSIMSYDRSFEKVLKIAENGTFTDTLDIKGSSYVLYDGKNPVFLYLEPGNNINIYYDAKNFDNSISISGNGSEINKYLISKRKIEKDLFGDAKETYSLDENNFKEKVRGIKKAQDSILKNSENISKSFVTKETRNTDYFYLKLLTDYEGAHKYFTNNSDFKVSENFLSEMDDIDYQNEEDYKYSNYYRSLVDDHFKNRAREVLKNDSIKTDDVYFKVLDSIQNETVRNGLLFKYANSDMNYSKDVETFYNNYVNRSTDEKHKNVITEKYNKLVGLKAGRPSPLFNNYENYKGGTTSLEDLKGKYVYIDVWATWCGPCIREIPALKEVEKQYHDKNIEFVSISIDKSSDKDKWRSMIEEKELGGIQLFAENEWKSKFVTEYQIQGIPRFILIDPKGDIVNANAPRPSSPELTELLTKLNI